MNNNLSIAHWNCNSIRNKIEIVKHYLNTNPIDVLCINEIKLPTVEANSILRIKEYCCYFKCRNNYGGGVAICIRNNIDCSPISMDNLTLNDSHAELIGLNIIYKKTKINLFSIYNPPSNALNSELLLNMFKCYV